MRILVVEDDPIVLEVVKAALEGLADELVTSRDGLEALEYIEQQNPQLVVTDLQMPVLDGFALVEALRSSPSHRALPIICMSGVSDREEISRLVGLGVTNYVLKPVDPELLRERVRRVRDELPASEPVSGLTGRRTILVVHPDQQMRVALHRTLAPWFKVLEARSAAEALRITRDHSPHPAEFVIAEGLRVIGEEKLVDLLSHTASVERGLLPAWLAVTEHSETLVAPPTFRGLVRCYRDPVALAREFEHLLDGRILRRESAAA